MITRWQRIQSWWYWNVSSHTSWVDIFAMVWFPFMAVVCIWAIWDCSNEAEKFSILCHSKNGVVLEGLNGYVCIDKSAVK